MDVYIHIFLTSALAGKYLTLPGLELRPLGCPARSQSLYRQRYPGSHLDIGGWIILKWILE
jgi:hypothetical protein